MEQPEAKREVVELLRSNLEGVRAEEYAAQLGIWSAPQDAVRFHTMALEIAPGYTLARFDRALRFSILGERAKARADYDRVLAIDPEFSGAWQNRGVLRLHDGDADGARSDLERAAELRPHDPGVHCCLGSTFRRLGQPQRALEAFGHAIDLRSDYAIAWSGRASVRQDLGDYAGAIRDYDRSLALAPRDPGALCNRAIARQHAGDPQ